MSLDKYIDLIHKELTGELRTEEAAQLTAWINASDANAEEAEQIRLTWNLSGKSDAELESLVDFSKIYSIVAQVIPKNSFLPIL